MDHPFDTRHKGVFPLSEPTGLTRMRAESCGRHYVMGVNPLDVARMRPVIIYWGDGLTDGVIDATQS